MRLKTRVIEMQVAVRFLVYLLNFLSFVVRIFSSLLLTGEPSRPRPSPVTQGVAWEATVLWSNKS
jgi:hypothetical protein